MKYGQHALNAMKEQAEPSTHEPTHAAAIDDLWEQMAEIWGRRFTSQYGVQPSATWLRALQAFTARDLMRGLALWCEEQAALQGGDGPSRDDHGWPPTLPQLVGSIMRPEHAHASHKPYPALPRPASDGKARQEFLDTMRARGILRQVHPTTTNEEHKSEPSQ